MNKLSASVGFAPRPPPGLCRSAPGPRIELHQRSTQLCLPLVYNVVYHLVVWEEGLFKSKRKAAEHAEGETNTSSLSFIYYNKLIFVIKFERFLIHLS